MAAIQRHAVFRAALTSCDIESNAKDRHAAANTWRCMPKAHLLTLGSIINGHQLCLIEDEAFGCLSTCWQVSSRTIASFSAMLVQRRSERMHVALF